MQAQRFWTKAYQKNINKMISVCYRYVGDRQVAEDLAHEAFLTAIEKSASYRQLGSFEGWLMRITLNTTLMYLRKRPNFISVEYAHSAGEIPVYEETSHLKENDFTQEEIVTAVCALPDSHRAVFNLYVFENQKHKQIAAALNIGERSSKRYLAEARQQLQQTLSQLQKNRKARMVITLSLLFRKSYAIDTVCKAKLSGLSLTPLSASPLTAVNWAAVPKPNGWIVLSAAQVPVTAGVTTGVVGALTTALVAMHPMLQPDSALPAAAKIVTMDTLSSENVEATTEEDVLEVGNLINKVTKLDSNSNNAMTSNVQSNTKSQEFIPIAAKSTQKQGYKKWRICQKHDFYGFCDNNGNIAVYPKYTMIDDFDVYKKGWALVEQFGYKGFIDSLGKEVVTPQYDDVGVFGQYRSRMALVSKGGFYGFINEKGEEIVPAKYSKGELIK